MIKKDITQNVIVAFKKKGDAEAKAAVKDVDREVLKAASGLQSMGDKAKAAFASVSDNAAKAMESLGRNAAAGFGAFGTAVKKASEAVAPLNQAIELGGKALRFAEAGLDAYAKTSAGAAKDVNALTTEFKHYRDTVMQNVGALTVELLKPAVAFEEQRKKLLEIGNTPAFKILYGNDGKRRDLRDLIETNLGPGGVDRLQRAGLITVTKRDDPFGSLQGAFAGFNEAVREGTDFWDTRGKTFIDDFTARMKEAAKATRGARVSTVASLTRSGGTDTAGPPIGFSTSLGAAAGFGNESDVVSEAIARTGARADAFLTETATRADRFAESATRRNETFLEGIFGPIDEFNAYGTAFETLSAATNTAMQAWISGSVSLGTAIKKGIGDALGALASQLAVEALKHGAFAIGSAAFGDFAGAGKHAAAAAAFGVGAVAAASAAKKLGGAGAGDVASQGRTTGAGAAPSFAGTGPAQGGGGERTVVIIGDAHARNSPRMEQLYYQHVIDTAYGSDGVTHR